MKLTTNFKLQEFVPQSVFKQFGQSATWFVNEPHIVSMQWLRDNLTKDFGKNIQLIVNNWDEGGPHHFRGLRTEKSLNFNPWSQHSYKCNASDFDSPQATVKELYDWIIANQRRIMHETSFRAVEDIRDTKGQWVHLDSRWIPSPNGLLVVRK